MFDGAADMDDGVINAVSPTFTEEADVSWLATLTGRVGFVAAPQLLLYVKGGAAFAHDEYNDLITATGDVNASAEESRLGWTVGGGVDYAFAPHWSAFAEYDFMDFGKDEVDFDGPGGPFSFQIDQNIQAVYTGVSYRFGGS
jgi:outer membrane immunogenic protein